jgi:hypothetical protein
MCAAIRDPIVPAPSTATLRICLIGSLLSDEPGRIPANGIPPHLALIANAPEVKTIRRLKTMEGASIRQVKFA